MKKKIFPLIVVLVIIVIISMQILKTKKNQKKKPREPGMHPNVWFMQQRIYPKNEEISISMVNKVLSESKKMYNMKRIDNLVWEEMGPYNISGRITDIEGVNGNDDTLYMGSASGGVYKSVDGGYTWFPIFDENGILPIGDIAINPVSHNIVYIGTGESNASSQSYPGNGIYKSVDAGLTWENIGLDSTCYIGRIVISPSNPNIVYVAATGKLFSKCENRGIYRSLDDGLTWEKVLFISDSTSAIDIVINPSHPDTIFAAMWERIRPLDSRKSGGVTSGIYRSEDGGNTCLLYTSPSPRDS